MDRCAILVDAGYLLAEGGKAYCGVRKRSLVTCDYPAAAAAIEDYCRTLHGLPALRTYWYDAANDGIPTEDHVVIAGLPRVKLRMGRLSGGRQKGVDSLIVHDLITLAHERAVASMYLLGGDEDLREGVAAAQRLGVQVSLLGIDTGRANQAPTLINEADEHIVLPSGLLQPHFGTVPGYKAPVPETAEGDAEAPEADQAKDDRAETDAATFSEESTLVAGERDIRAEEADADQLNLDVVRAAGEQFGRAWAERVLEHQVAELLLRAPKIPVQLDVQLLVSAEERLEESLRGKEQLRRALRDSFWNSIRRAAEED